MTRARERLMENETASLWIYPETGIVHHQLHRPISGQAFRDLLNLGLKQFQEGRATMWLSDDRANTILDPNDSEWSGDVWYPRMIKAGWKFWAVVLPEKSLGQINMRRLAVEVGERQVVVEMFADPAAALAWLEGLREP